VIASFHRKNVQYKPAIVTYTCVKDNISTLLGAILIYWWAHLSSFTDNGDGKVLENENEESRKGARNMQLMVHGGIVASS
jgi:hypothetical protein